MRQCDTVGEPFRKGNKKPSLGSEGVLFDKSSVVS